MTELYLALTAPKYLVSSSKEMVPLSDVLTFFAMAIAAGNITTNSMGTAYEVRYCNCNWYRR